MKISLMPIKNIIKYENSDIIFYINPSEIQKKL